MVRSLFTGPLRRSTMLITLRMHWVFFPVDLRFCLCFSLGFAKTLEQQAPHLKSGWNMWIVLGSGAPLYFLCDTRKNLGWASLDTGVVNHCLRESSFQSYDILSVVPKLDLFLWAIGYNLQSTGTIICCLDSIVTANGLPFFFNFVTYCLGPMPSNS